MKCIVCSKELTTGDFESICNGCKNKLSKSPIVSASTNYGWECPKCGKVYAPIVNECGLCNVEKSYANSTTFCNCKSNSTSTRYWIDFDLDVDKNWRVYEEDVLKNWFENKKIKTYFWIDTKSGYHLLISKEDLRFNPKELVNFIKQGYCNWLFSTYDLETAQEKLDSCEIIKNKYTNAVLTLSNFVEEFVNHIGLSIIPLMNDEFVEQKEDLNLEEFVKQFSESKSFQMKVFEIFKESVE